jgi:PhnB protein
MPVNPIPDGYHSVTPYLVIDGAAKAIEFYKNAFGAVELFRMDKPCGGIAHAEIKIGDSPVMLADEFPEYGIRGPKALSGTPVSLMIYVEDCDAVFRKAVTAGASVKQEPADQFWGDRMGKIEDPFGHIWSIATHTEDLSPDEITRRAEEWKKQQAASA